jgi:hypothetical protein
MTYMRSTPRLLRSAFVVACGLAWLATDAGVATAALPPESTPRPDAAALLEAAGAPTCVCEEERLELERYVAYVAAATSAEEARERATKPSRIARRAIAMARWIAPERSKLDATRERLAAYEARVGSAATPTAVAAEMGELVRLAGANVRTSSCSYDTAEIIAIVLGFLFFIIPGIILLILFC